MSSAHEDTGRMELRDGRQLGYREFGAPSGRPLLYCHGMPGSRLEPAVLADAAAARDIRIVVADRPGYGATSSLGPRTLGDELDDVRALVDGLGLESFDLLGFSGGGPHAMAVAAALPDRVQRLTLVSSWSPFDAAGLEGMNEGFRQLWTLAQADFPAFRSTLSQALDEAGDAYSLLFAGAPEADRAILSEAFVNEAYRQNTREATRSGLEGMFEDAGAVMGEWPFHMDAITCPVHIWHGERDGNAPVAMGRWLAAHLPRAELIEWPGATHFEFFRRADEVLASHARP